MKLFCFLITFVLVNVSAEDDPDVRYRKQFLLTNNAIDMAFNRNESRTNGLEFVIEKMVNDASPSPIGIQRYYNLFGKINYMIAVPEKIEICDTIPGLGDFPPIIKGAYYQLIMRQEIRKVLNMKVPEPEDIQHWGNLNRTSEYLEYLVQERTRRVKPALENIIRRVLSPEYNVPQVFVDHDGRAYDVLLFRLCRLTGMLLSIISPETYIKKVRIDSNNGTCTLDDGTKKIIYKKNNNEWSHINPGNGPVQQNEDQLALNMGSLRID